MTADSLILVLSSSSILPVRPSRNLLRRHTSDVPSGRRCLSKLRVDEARRLGDGREEGLPNDLGLAAERLVRDQREEQRLVGGDGSRVGRALVEHRKVRVAEEGNDLLRLERCGESGESGGGELGAGRVEEGSDPVG